MTLKVKVCNFCYFCLFFPPDCTTHGNSAEKVSEFYVNLRFLLSLFHNYLKEMSIVVKTENTFLRLFCSKITTFVDINDLHSFFE